MAKPQSEPEQINPVRKRQPTSGSPCTRDLSLYLRALTRFILVRTEEEHLFLETFLGMMSKYRERIWVFDAEHGLKLITPYLRLVRPCQEDPCNDRLEFIRKHSRPEVSEKTTQVAHTAMSEITSHDPRGREHFYLILDPEMWFNDSVMLRRLINLSLSLQVDQDTIKCLLFVGHPSVAIPPNLAKFLSPVVYGLPERSVQNRLKESILKNLSFFNAELPSVDLGELFSGLTCYEAEELVMQAMVLGVPRDEMGCMRQIPRVLDLDVLKDLIEARRKVRSKL